MFFTCLDYFSESRFQQKFCHLARLDSRQHQTPPAQKAQQLRLAMTLLGCAEIQPKDSNPAYDGQTKNASTANSNAPAKPPQRLSRRVRFQSQP